MYGNYSGMMGNYGGGGWIAMFIFGFLATVALVALVVWLVRGASHGTHHPGIMPSGPAPLPPLDKTPTLMDAHEEAVAIAKKRLANGDITTTEYTAIMEALHQETIVR